MKALILPPTNSTPGIWFDPAVGRLELTGNSIPENASEFYQPIIAWLSHHLPELDGPQVLQMHLSYFNSTSLKAIYKLLKCVKDANTMGAQVTVRWYSEEEEDELLVETVAMLSEMLDMPMAIVPGQSDQQAKAAN